MIEVFADLKAGEKVVIPMVQGDIWITMVRIWSHGLPTASLVFEVPAGCQVLRPELIETAGTVWGPVELGGG